MNSWSRAAWVAGTMILGAPGWLLGAGEAVWVAPPVTEVTGEAPVDRVDSRDRGPLTRVDRGVLNAIEWLPEAQDGVDVLNRHEMGTDVEAARLRDHLRVLQNERTSTDAGRWLAHWPLIAGVGAAGLVAGTAWSAVKAGLVAPLFTASWRAAVPGLVEAGRAGARVGWIALGAAIAGTLAVHAWREWRHARREGAAVERFQREAREGGPRHVLDKGGGRVEAPLERADGAVIRALRWLPGSAEKVDALNYHERADPGEAHRLHQELAGLDRWNRMAQPAPLPTRWPLVATMAGIGVIEGLVRGITGLGPAAAVGGPAGVARLARAGLLYGLVGAGLGIGLLAAHRAYKEIAGTIVQHVTLSRYRSRTEPLYSEMRARPLPAATPACAPSLDGVEDEMARTDRVGRAEVSW